MAMLDSVLGHISSRTIDYTWFTLWASSFIFSLVLAFPPSRLKRWRRYCIALLLYVLIQVVLIIITMEAIGRAAAADDGAALMLAP